MVSALGGRRVASTLLDDGLVTDLYLTGVGRSRPRTARDFYDGPPLLHRRVLAKGGRTRLERRVRFEHLVSPTPGSWQALRRRFDRVEAEASLLRTTSDVAGRRLSANGASRREERPQEAQMKGNPKVVAELNMALKEELTAINQYFLHAEMCHKWGYHALGSFIKKQSIDEMKHAEKLIERLLFLDSMPKMDYLELNIGSDVKGAARRPTTSSKLNAVADVQQGGPGSRARKTTTRRASSSRCSSRTKSSTSSGSRRSSIRSRSWATRRTCRTRPKGEKDWEERPDALQFGVERTTETHGFAEGSRPRSRTGHPVRPFRAR